jgi:hypothetical protein
MRRVIVSQTARMGLRRHIDQGLPKFGSDVVEEKALLVNAAIHGPVQRQPRNGIYDERLKLYAYPVSNTPFTIVYRFDDTELRVLFIVHQHADRTRLDPAKVRW